MTNYVTSFSSALQQPAAHFYLTSVGFCGTDSYITPYDTRTFTPFYINQVGMIEGDRIRKEIDMTINKPLCCILIDWLSNQYFK